MRNMANQKIGISAASRLRNQDAAESKADVGIFTNLKSIYENKHNHSNSRADIQSSA